MKLRKFQKTCGECGSVFETNRNKKRFCSDGCRNKNWVAQYRMAKNEIEKIKHERKASIKVSHLQKAVELYLRPSRLSKRS